MKEIISGIYVSTFYPDVNVGFVCVNGGAVAIDAPPLPSDAQTWRETILSTAGGPVRYTILTDHRLDRALSARLLGAPIVAARATLHRLKELKEREAETVQQWARQHLDRADELAGLTLPLPEITVSGRLTLHHGSPEVIVETVQGAAPGSVWVLLPEQRVLFAGDTLVVHTHPLLDEAPDTGAWLQTLTRIRRPSFPADLLVPGRGPICGKEQTHSLSDYLRQVRRRIRSLHRTSRGKSTLAGLVDELIARFPVEANREGEIRIRIRRGLERVYVELEPGEA